MKFTFYTPVSDVKENFGVASFGLVGADDPTIPSAITVPFEINGTIVHGTYESCLQQLQGHHYQVGIVFTGNTGGEDEFIRTLAKKFDIPLVGGGAAINPVSGEKARLYGESEAAVCLISDDRYDFEVLCENIHRKRLGTHRLGFTDPRVLETIDGCDAVAWLREEKAKRGFPEMDFEHLTFADMNGVNAHLSAVDGKIHSGRNLEPQMELRLLEPDTVQAQMQAFYDDPTAIVFGCAGLKGLLPKPLVASSVGLFLFGEVCSTNGTNAFGNLMLSKLRIIPKQKIVCFVRGD